MVGCTLSQEARELALSYGGSEFLQYVLNVFLPLVRDSSSHQRRLLLRTDFPVGDDRNIVNTAWSQYRFTLLT